MDRDIVFVALFAALIAALGFIPPLTLGFGVPITAQSLGVMLCGTVLGSKRGALAVILFLVLVFAGLPLLSGGRGGVGLLATPSVGFLLAWPIAAFVTGFFVEQLRSLPIGVVATVGSLVGGIFVLYAFGTLGMSKTLDKSIAESAVLVLAFIPGDIIKAIVAGLITGAIYKARPRSVLARA